MKGVRLLRNSEPYVKNIKKITMRSILKKIAVCKKYKENKSMEAGVDPTTIRTAAELARQLGYYLLRADNTFAFRLHSAVYTKNIYIKNADLED